MFFAYSLSCSSCFLSFSYFPFTHFSLSLLFNFFSFSFSNLTSLSNMSPFPLLCAFMCSLLLLLHVLLLPSSPLHFLLFCFSFCYLCLSLFLCVFLFSNLSSTTCSSHCAMSIVIFSSLPHQHVT